MVPVASRDALRHADATGAVASPPAEPTVSGSGRQAHPGALSHQIGRLAPRVLA